MRRLMVRIGICFERSDFVANAKARRMWRCHPSRWRWAYRLWTTQPGGNCSGGWGRGAGVTEVDAYNQLLATFGPTRARQLLGTMRLLLLLGREAVQKRRLMAVSTFYADLAALRTAGVMEYVEALEATRKLTDPATIWPMPTAEQLEVVLRAHLDPLLAASIVKEGGLTSETLATTEDLIVALYRVQVRELLQRLYDARLIRPDKDPITFEK